MDIVLSCVVKIDIKWPFNTVSVMITVWTDILKKKHKRGFILKNISLYRNEPHVSLVMQEVS